MSSVIAADLLRGLLQYGLKLTALALLLIMYTRRKRIQRRCFAWFYGRYVAPALKEPLKTCKKELFAPMLEMNSADPELRSNGSIRVLEIGVGTGVNLEYYPPGCRLVSVEPNPFFQRFFELNQEAFNHVTVERFVTSHAEDMSEISDNSVDVVVSTYVLCSVKDIKGVLREIVRILAPGGKFFYLEHVRYEPGTWGRRIQQVFDPVWKVLNDDCTLSANTSQLIRSAAFGKIVEKIMFLNQVAYVMRPHISGVATK